MFLDKEVDVSKAEGLFKEVKYYVTGEICEKVQQLLSTGEAKKTSYLSGLNTHCIVGSQPDMNEVSLSLSLSLWLNRSFMCMETTYPYAIKNQRKARNGPSTGLHALNWFFKA